MHDPNCNDPDCPGFPDNMPGVPMVELITSCGHEIQIPTENLPRLMDYITLGTIGAREVIMPCPECGVEQVMTPTKLTFHLQSLADFEKAAGIVPLDKPIPRAHNPRHN